MTNSQSPRTIDWVIGNLKLRSSVDYVPKSNPPNTLILLCNCSANLKSARSIFVKNYGFNFIHCFQQDFEV